MVHLIVNLIPHIVVIFMIFTIVWSTYIMFSNIKIIREMIEKEVNNNLKEYKQESKE